MNQHAKRVKGDREQRRDPEDVEKVLDADEAERGGYVPFEKEQEPEQQWKELEGTTITPSEAKAFEGLFNLPEGTKGKDKKKKKKKIATPAGESAPVGPGVPALTPQSSEVSIPDTSAFSPALRRMAEKAREQREQQREQQRQKRYEQKHMRTREAYLASQPQQRKVATAAERELEEVRGEMERAGTDVEVWGVLWERVLKRVVGVLEGENQSGEGESTKKEKKKKKKKGKKGKEEPEDEEAKQQKPDVILQAPQSSPSNPSTQTWISLSPSLPSPAAPPTPQPPSNDLPLLTSTLPTHLTQTFRHLATHYPISPLPLTLLGTVKSLGPAAFALGASTALYNLHMRAHFQAYADPEAVVAVLGEMEREVYEFNAGTLRLLDFFLGTQKRRGYSSGGGAGAVGWASERRRRGFRALRGWRGRVKGRLEERALRGIREREEWRRGEVERLRLGSGRGGEERVEEEGRESEMAWLEGERERMGREELIEEVLRGNGGGGELIEII